MPQHATHWVRIKGDGLIYDGPCIVKHIIMWPDAAADHADIYDGRDKTSGEKFCRIEANWDQTLPINLDGGVLFGRGIYIDAKDPVVETTVAFIPL